MTSPFGPIKPIGFGGQPIVRSMFRSLAIAASGLSAQRQRLDVVSQNIANSETTHTDAGGPYKRRTVTMEQQNIDSAGFRAELESNGVLGLPQIAAIAPIPMPGTPEDLVTGVRVTGIGQDNSEGPLVYEPGHPDADKNGYVRYPNVRITDEMVDLMDARRVYEANATVFQSAKSMLRRAIDI
ncbi:MAG: flagellar basal body rod protein FlgC [Gemmatimonadota bacterium]|nr:flagellar basal body rod protein FlgC [Gemmatimonadota bacterium]